MHRRIWYVFSMLFDFISRININMIISLSIIYSKNLLLYKSFKSIFCNPFILTKRINGQTKASYLSFQSIVYFQLHEILLFPDVSVICLWSPKIQCLEWVSRTITHTTKNIFIVLFISSYEQLIYKWNKDYSFLFSFLFPALLNDSWQSNIGLHTNFS